MWYISKQMNRVKPDVIYARRKARQGKTGVEAFGYGASSSFNPGDSESALPLPKKADENFQHQQWDSAGRAVGYSGDPTLFAPQPQRVPLGPFTAKATTSTNVKLVPSSTGARDNYPPASAPAAYRQGTAQSWDAQGTVGTHDVYQMTRQQSPPSDPFAELPLPPRLPPPGSPQTGQYSSPRSQPQYASTSPGPQKNFSIPPPPGLSSPQTAPAPNSIPQYSPPQYQPGQFR